MCKNLFALVLIGLAAMSSPVASYAADGLYIGPTGGVMDNDRNGFDDALNAGFILGYEFLGIGIGDIAVEGTYTATVDDGDAPRRQNWEIQTLAAYGVLRTAGPVYLKAKAGLLSADIEIDRISEDETEFSAGLGAGFSVGIAQFEIEYTQIQDDVDFISLTLNFKTPL